MRARVIGRAVTASLLACLLLGLVGCGDQQGSAPSSAASVSVSGDALSSAASDESSSGVSAQASSGGESATVKQALSPRDFVLSDLKMVESEGVDAYNNWYYEVSGSITNNGKLDAAKFEVVFEVSQIKSDSYGDSKEEPNASVSDLLVVGAGMGDGGNIGTGKYVIECYDMKAGEQRDFTLAFKNAFKCATPTLTAHGVSDEHSSTLMGHRNEGNAYIDIDGSKLPSSFESYAPDSIVARTQNKTGKLLSDAIVRAAFVDDEGHLDIAEFEFSHFRPSAEYPMRAGIVSDTARDMRFLDACYWVAPDQDDAKGVVDDFDIAVDAERCEIQITNKTGKYLSSAEVFYALSGIDENTQQARAYMETARLEYLKPGETYSVSIERASRLKTATCEVYDVVYEVDAKKSQAGKS